MEFSSKVWEKWSGRYRGVFFNSLGGLKPVGLLCSKNINGKANAGVFSQIIHIGSNPPTWGFLFRPPTNDHQTYGNILRNPYFNFIPATSFLSEEQLHQCSAKYSTEVSELDSLNIKWEMDQTFEVPMLLDSDIQFTLKRSKSHEMSNGTILIEAEIVRVISNIKPKEDGFMDLTQKGLISSQGLDAYSITNRVIRQKYPNP
ncbi:MAG: Uncharacterised protein [Owenweeksia sp. TMED14]|nr:MAG: Uncharacterised protein [Owenweeksia sp. TMED14]